MGGINARVTPSRKREEQTSSQREEETTRGQTGVKCSNKSKGKEGGGLRKSALGEEVNQE